MTAHSGSFATVGLSTGRRGGLPGLFAQRLPVSKRLGPLIKLNVHRVHNDYDMLHAATASVKEISQRSAITAAGGGFSRQRSMSAALGEALERLSLRSHRYWRLVSHPYLDPERQLDPSALLHVPPGLFKDLRLWSPAMEINWISGRELGSRKIVDVPAFAVFPDAEAHTRDGIWLFAGTSTGTAAARDPVSAALSALYEIVERDAFTLHWENRWPGRLMPPTCEVEQIRTVLARKQFELQVRRLDTDMGVPVALAAVSDHSGERAAIAFGASARATWTAAAFRAAEEALLTSLWVTSRHAQEQRTYGEAREVLDGVPSPAEHAFLYGFHQAAEETRFLFSATEIDSGSFDEVADTVTPAAELAWLASRIGGLGERIVWVDITHPLARRLDICVIRMVVSGLLPLARGVARPIRNPRLRQAADRMGRPHLADSNFNPVPHPFP